MDTELKHQVKDFYDQIGWQQIGDQLYQNAIYEDLRPVSREYINRCHLRVNRHIKQEGKYLLDAGSGPVQWPEYLTYSQGYRYRVCLDISIVALKEARKRLGQKGLYVVADVTNLPFIKGVFDGAVSLHTFHHLSLEEQKKAYWDLLRVLIPAASAVVVNGYSVSPLMLRFNRLISIAEKLTAKDGHKAGDGVEKAPKHEQEEPQQARGTFVEKNTYDWIQNSLSGIRHGVFPWRSISVRFMRALIHPALGGRIWLKFIYWLEERFPGWFAKNGQYPMVIIYKEK